jgi:hypothetical protein
LEQYPISPAEAAHIVAPTAGDIKASTIYMILILSPNPDKPELNIEDHEEHKDKNRLYDFMVSS